MMEITIRVPDELGKRLQRLENRLPEILERALAQNEDATSHISADEQEILNTLTRNPSPQTIISLRPSETLQARMSELLEANKLGTLNHEQEIELERYLTLEHWVRLAKANAYASLAQAE